MTLNVNNNKIPCIVNPRRRGLVSLLRLLTISVFSATTAAILISTFVFLNLEYRKDVAEVSQEITDDAKAAMRQQVDQAVEFVDFARENLGWSPAKAQEFVKKHISKISYADGQGYIFIDNYQGVIIAHPSSELIGQDMWEMEDVNGVKIAQELVAAAKRGGGFVSYTWMHPIAKKHTPKITYARSVDDWQWVVCSGLYLVDIDEAVALRRDKLRGDLAQHAAIILGVAALSLAIIIICLLRISRNVGDELRQIERGMAADTSEHESIRPEAFRIPEFEVIAAGLKQAFYRVEQVTGKLIHEQEIVRASEQQLTATNQQLTANEQQLRATNQQLTANEQEREKLLGTLKYKNTELQDIVYTASHDLRSPLINIDGFSGVLQSDCDRLAKLLLLQDGGQCNRDKVDEILSDAIPASLNYIRCGAKKMSSLLDGLLQISRVGTIELTSETIDMDKTIGEVLAAMEYQIEESGITVKTEPLVECKADANMVNIVFSNLIGNAIKYRDPEKEGEIVISGSVINGMSVYSVQDNGIGIEEEHQERVFEIFHRLNPDNSTEGEGLGLTIVTRILNRLGGKIRLDSEPGKGSKFYVELPFC